MNLIDALLGEHGAFSVLFDTIEKVAKTDGELAQIESATTILTAELLSHATFEEKSLFPALDPHLADGNIIADLYAEHQAIRDGLEQIQDALDLRGAVDATQQTLLIARKHFRKEEEILYVTARRVLDDDAQSRLAETWAAARSVNIS